jgi:glycosyltransferase involved in cell wall biosynthesis
VRVAIVSEYPKSPGEILGGVQAVVRHLAVEMAGREDLEVHVVAATPGLASSRTEEMEGVLVHRLPGTVRFGNLTMGRAERRATVRALVKIDPDVVNAHVLGPATLAAADADFPWVATGHGILDAYGRTLPGSLANRVRAWSYSTMERQCLRRTRHLIVISPYVREYFGSRLDGVTTWEIENPVSAEFFAARGPGDPTRIVYTGRLVPLKSPETLLEAAGRLAADGLDFGLRMVGPADDGAYLDSLRARAKAEGVEDRVEFPGNRSGPELAGELAASGIFVLPSLQETASVSVMEAMAVGLPVVATDVGGTRHLVREGVTGALVRRRDAGGLAEALARYLRDPETATRHGVAGRAVAEDRFRVDRAVDRTLEVYRRVIAEVRERPHNPLDRESVIS